MKAKRSPLEHVQRLIKKLSAEDKQKIIPFLAQFPESGLQSYDLTEEINALEKHGVMLPPEGSSDEISLVFIRDLVEVNLANRKIAHARFFTENLAETYATYKDQIAMFSEALQKTEGQKASRRKNLEAQGIHQTDAEFDAGFKEACDDAARLWVAEKGKRIAERISRHFPGMVADMMIAAIKGQTFYDLAEAAKAFGKDIPSSAPIKKAVQDIAWRELKPHLPSTRHSRTPQDWRSPETVKQYAQLVTDRKALATRIREMYEECDHAPGWMEDLRSDATFQRLSVGVPEAVLVWAMKKVADDESGDSRERQALSIALEMARQEMGLTELDVETLRNKNDQGNKLIKADRKKRADTEPSGI